MLGLGGVDGALRCRLGSPLWATRPQEVQDRARSEKRKDMGNRLEDCPLYHQVSAWDCYESIFFFLPQ